MAHYVLAQALARSWIDEPAIARRMELQRSVPDGQARAPEGPLQAARVRALLEREREIALTLSRVESAVRMYSQQLHRAIDRRAELLSLCR